MRTDWVSKSVDIAPGHRILIAEFVTKVPSMIQPKTTLATKRKTCTPSESSKKQKLTVYPTPESNGSNITVNYERSTTDLADIASKIRMQIAKWQRMQPEDQVKQLKEHEQFELRVSRSENPEIPADVCITCMMCDKHLPLSKGSKYASFSISNWTRHVKVCVLKKKQKASRVTQSTLSNFLPHITNKSLQRSSKTESIGEASSHLCVSESSSGNQSTLSVQVLGSAVKVNRIFRYPLLLSMNRRG